MPIYEKDEPIPGFEPEDEVAFPNQTKVLRPKKYKTKTTPRRKSKIKRTIIKTLIFLTLIIGALGYGTYKVNEWFNTHTIKWQSPVQTPIWIEERTASGHEAIKEAEAKEINFDGADFIHKTEAVPDPNTEAKPALSEVVRKVYQLESSGGKNDGCRAKGLYNGYGYGQSTFTWNCFQSHDEVTAKVSSWFETRIPTMGLSTALCYYNTGHKVTDCDYYQKYLKLK